MRPLSEVRRLSLRELRECVKEALMSGHETLMEALSEDRREVVGRGGFGDLSYGFDRLTEKAIVDALTRKLDNFYLISEELGFIPRESPEYYVVVDPVDGSTNAFYGIPFYASSIAISSSPKAEDILVAGVIDHARRKIFLGDKESGVSVDQHAPSLRKTSSLQDSLIQMNLDAIKDERAELRKWAERIIGRSKHLRCFSAASLEICYLLEGKADAYICLTPNLKVMDFYASAFLLKWAGGAYTILGGEPTLLDKGKYGIIAASNQALLQEILSLRK